MSTKKVFIELVEYLESHKDSKIGDILTSEAFKDIITAKKNTTTVLKDENDNVIAIFCYYHKQWELLKDVEYGTKVSSATGFNTMCKIGVNKWTKQHNDAKKAKAELLDQVASGEIKPQDVAQLVNDIDRKRDTIDKENMPKGTKETPKV